LHKPVESINHEGHEGSRRQPQRQDSFVYLRGVCGSCTIDAINTGARLTETLHSLPYLAHNSQSKEVPMTARSARSANPFIPLHIHPP